MTIEQLVTFLSSVGALTGLIGAFLLCAASYFRRVGIDFRKRPLGHSALYIVGGYFAGALLDYTRDLDALYCAALGAAWPYLAIGLLEGGKAIAMAIGDWLREGSEVGNHLFDPSSGADVKAGADDG